MSFITTLIYQPFFNLLLAFYYFLDQIPGRQADMGVAVIFLTLTIRLLMLPLTIASTRTKKERRDIEEKINQIKKDFASQPQRLKSEIKKTFQTNRRVVISEGINFTIQMIIFFILYRIFTTGLLGPDLDLIYDFMPRINFPFNLTFLSKFDLTKTSFTLNLFQSFTILILEVLSLINSPFPSTRTEFVRYTIILPAASFFIFMFLPAGKKLFVITTLWFSISFTLISMLYRSYLKFVNKWETIGITPPSPVDQPSSPNTENPDKME